MGLDMQVYLENRRRFLENRPRFPLVELSKHAGNWVAWSPDGTHIVAIAAEPEALDELVLAAGEDPQQCIIEGIPDEE